MSYIDPATGHRYSYREGSGKNERHQELEVKILTNNQRSGEKYVISAPKGWLLFNRPAFQELIEARHEKFDRSKIAEMQSAGLRSMHHLYKLYCGGFQTLVFTSCPDESACTCPELRATIEKVISILFSSQEGERVKTFCPRRTDQRVIDWAKHQRDLALASGYPGPADFAQEVAQPEDVQLEEAHALGLTSISEQGARPENTATNILNGTLPPNPQQHFVQGWNQEFVVLILGQYNEAAQAFTTAIQVCQGLSGAQMALQISTFMQLWESVVCTQNYATLAIQSIDIADQFMQRCTMHPGSVSVQDIQAWVRTAQQWETHTALALERTGGLLNALIPPAE